MPENLTEALIRLADGRNIEKVWNPATRTGGFLAAAHRQYPQWQLYGCEEEKSQWQIARMLQFYHGGGMEGIRREDPLEADRIDKTGERTPEGECLSALEYRLLLFFLNHKGMVLTRGQLLEEIWDAAGEFVNDNTLTVYIKRLREKIETDPQNPTIIRTVRGLGYKLE